MNKISFFSQLGGLWLSLTEHPELNLIVLRKLPSSHPADGMGVFASTVTYFTIKAPKRKKKSTYLLVGINSVRLLDVLGYIAEGCTLSLCKLQQATAC